MPDLTTVLPAGPVAWNFGQHTQETEFKRAAEGLPLIKQLPFALSLETYFKMASDLNYTSIKKSVKLGTKLYQ